MSEVKSSPYWYVDTACISYLEKNLSVSILFTVWFYQHQLSTYLSKFLKLGHMLPFVTGA